MESEIFAIDSELMVTNMEIAVDILDDGETQG